jgi:D-alanine-D-alanine ligase
MSAYCVALFRHICAPRLTRSAVNVDRMQIHRRLKVGVVFGGRSAEHEVSILSARNIIAALDPARFEPIPIGITRDGRWLLQSTERLLREKGDPREVRIDTAAPVVSLANQGRSTALVEVSDRQRVHDLDVVFPIVHGPMGEDGTLQGLLELVGVPYVGAGVLGSAVGMDKDVMKRLLRDAGLPIPRFEVVRYYEHERNPSAVLKRFGTWPCPVFVKPANLGSSVGVTRVTSREQLPAAFDTAFGYDAKVLVEEGVTGREIECAVLGNDEPIASLPGELVVDHPDGFYSYDAKYIDEGVGLRVPAALDDTQVREVQALSLAVFRTLECRGLARVDFFLRPNGQWLVNEINTLPGFTAISMYPKLWAASGIEPRELVTRLIELALTVRQRGGG